MLSSTGICGCGSKPGHPGLTPENEQIPVCPGCQFSHCLVGEVEFLTGICEPFMGKYDVEPLMSDPPSSPSLYD